MPSALVFPISVVGWETSDLTSFFDGLGADQKAQLLRTLSSVAEELVRRPKPGTETFRDISDEIDASLAAEAVEQLEHSYRRVLTLDEMTTPTIAFDGSEYFEEAHRCELNGQKIAAAVLCQPCLKPRLSAQRIKMVGSKAK